MEQKEYSQVEYEQELIELSKKKIEEITLLDLIKISNANFEIFAGNMNEFREQIAKIESRLQNIEGSSCQLK